MLYATGMRLDELCHLRCADIIHSSMKIYIRHSKNHSDRYVPLTESIWQMILDYWYTFPAPERPREWLFTQQTRLDQPMDKQWIQREGLLLRRSRGMDSRISAHSFRHAYATRCYENGMDLLIVSGLSGAGKSVAMNALEDIGFFCIDNVPAELLPSITAFSKAGDNQLKRVALSMDVRGCHTSEQIEQALHQLDEQGIEYEILFIDAPDDVLMRRYSETRRRHPISIAEGISTREALAKERQILQPFRERADYTINTEFLSTAQNKERICNLFAPDGGAKAAMRLTVMSFGFKFGIPEDANLVLDVRCLPNPFYIPELKHKTGLDEEVVDFVMGHPEAKELLRRYESFLEYALPLYVKEGKSQLTIAVGCTGGKHRSITFARKIAEYCKQLGYQTGIQHRDAAR